MKDSDIVARNAYNKENDDFEADQMVRTLLFQSSLISRYHKASGKHWFGYLNGGQFMKETKDRLKYLCVPDAQYNKFIGELAERQYLRTIKHYDAHSTHLNEYGNKSGANVAPLFLDLDWTVPYKTLGNANNVRFNSTTKTFQHPALKKEIFDDIIRVVVSVLDRYVDGTTAHKKEYWKFSVTCPNRLRFYEHGIKFGGHLRAEQRKTETGESIGGPLLSKENLKNVATLIAHALTKDTTLGPLLDWFEVVDPAPLSAQGMRLPREFKGKETKKEKYCTGCYPLWVDPAFTVEPDEAKRLVNVRALSTGCWCNDTHIGLRKKVCHVPVACYSHDERDDESLQELTAPTKLAMFRTLTRLSIWTPYLTQNEADKGHNNGSFRINETALLEDVQDLPPNTKKKEIRICGADEDGNGVSLTVKISGKKRKTLTWGKEPGIKQTVWQSKEMTTHQIEMLGRLIRTIFPHYGNEVDARTLSCPPGGKIYRLTLKGTGCSRCLNKPRVLGEVVPPPHADGNPTYIIITDRGFSQRCHSPNVKSECRTNKACKQFRSDNRGWRRQDPEEMLLSAKVQIWLYPECTSAVNGTYKGVTGLLGVEPRALYVRKPNPYQDRMLRMAAFNRQKKKSHVLKKNAHLS